MRNTFFENKNRNKKSVIVEKKHFTSNDLESIFWPKEWDQNKYRIKNNLSFKKHSQTFYIHRGTNNQIIYSPSWNLCIKFCKFKYLKMQKVFGDLMLNKLKSI